MCLKFDPEENTVTQTCSGKCKNKCGLEKHKEGKTIDLSNLTKKENDIRLDIPFKDGLVSTKEILTNQIHKG